MQGKRRPRTAPRDASEVRRDWRPRLGLLLLVLAGAAVYANSFAGALVFDDEESILHNPSLRSLWPIWRALWAPSQSPLAGRPMANLSMAVNYALGGAAPWGYHAVNLALHLASSLLFCGIVRWTLLTPRLVGRYRSAATWLAFSCAVLWTVHPLVTESVTYLTQRTELLAGCWYLLTLYAAIRGGASASHQRAWHVLAIAACAFGMGSKETMVTAPLVVVAYDRVFLASSGQASWLRRKGLYAGLAATWVILAWLQASGPRAQTVGGVVSDATSWAYAATQAGVILRYLQLAVWPHPLILDYGDWATARALGISLPAVVVVSGLMLATLWALRRRPALGFLGLWFFAILAPSSSVVPVISEFAAERRMYLPLQAVVVLGVMAGDRALRRLLSPVRLRQTVGAGLVGLLVVILGARTIARNADYQSLVSIWRSTVAHRPWNARAHANLGLALARDGRVAEAIVEYAEALRLRPQDAATQNSLGSALAQQGRHHEAISHYREAIRLRPDLAEAHNNLGLALAEEGKMDEALASVLRAFQLQPHAGEVRANLGTILSKLGRIDEAIAQYRAALRVMPDAATIHCDLGIMLARRGRHDEAIVEYTEALRLNPRNPSAHNSLGASLASVGRLAEAAQHYIQALRLKPDYANAHLNLGLALMEAGHLPEAIAHDREAVRLQPDFFEARRSLGLALAEQGDVQAALKELSAALQLKPNDPAASAKVRELQAQQTEAPRVP